MKTRCFWAGHTERMTAYHDTEWGVPVHDDRKLFEFMVLDGAQAGLSWSTILNKRENYRAAFDNFDAKKVALYGPEKIALGELAKSGVARISVGPLLFRLLLKRLAVATDALRRLDEKGFGPEWQGGLWN